MAAADVITVVEIAEPVLCVLAVCSLLYARATRQFGFLIALLSTKACAAALAAVWLKNAPDLVGDRIAYLIYFYFYWSMFAVESVLMLAVICSMYRLAMAPLKGLHNLGMLVFKWVAAISILIALGSAFAPHITRLHYLRSFVSQLQRSQSILILCLLLFVCFAIRPMGLSYRSRIFGVSLGLGVMATTNMIQSAWISEVSNMYGLYTIISDGAICLTLLTWTVYFIMPEPQRRLITLPTTSPFLRWNQISEVLGDSPGHVAIGGLPPEMLAPAELEIMRRASIKMKANWTAGQSTDAA